MKTVQTCEGSRSLQPDGKPPKKEDRKNSVSDRTRGLLMVDRMRSLVLADRSSAENLERHSARVLKEHCQTGNGIGTNSNKNSNKNTNKKSSKKSSKDSGSREISIPSISNSESIEAFSGDLETGTVNLKKPPSVESPVNARAVETVDLTGVMSQPRVSLKTLLDGTLPETKTNLFKSDVSVSAVTAETVSLATVLKPSVSGQLDYQHSIDIFAPAVDDAAQKESTEQTIAKESVVTAERDEAVCTPDAVKSKAIEPTTSGVESDKTLLANEIPTDDEIASSVPSTGEAAPDVQSTTAYRALRRPRLRCGGIDRHFLERSGVEARRAMAWDDLRFRYGRLPTAVRSSSDDEIRAHEDEVTTIALLRRPRSGRSQFAPAYVSELAQFDSDPALGARIRNPFEIHQLELPLPDMQHPVTERRIVEASRERQEAHNSKLIIGHKGGTAKVRGKWWELSQTLLQRTSLAMIFTALMIAGAVLFEQPVIEVVDQTVQGVNPFRSQLPSDGGLEGSVPTESTKSAKQKSSGKLPVEAEVVPRQKLNRNTSGSRTVALNTNHNPHLGFGVWQDIIAPAHNANRTDTVADLAFESRVFTDSIATDEITTDDNATDDIKWTANHSNINTIITSNPALAFSEVVQPTYMGVGYHTRFGRRSAVSANSGFDEKVAIDRHPEAISQSVRDQDSSSLLASAYILNADIIALRSRNEIAYLGMADAHGRNRLSFSVSQKRNTAKSIHPFLVPFDLSPLKIFRFEGPEEIQRPAIMVKSDNTVMVEKPTAMESQISENFIAENDASEGPR